MNARKLDCTMARYSWLPTPTTRALRLPVSERSVRSVAIRTPITSHTEISAWPCSTGSV